MMEEYDDSDIGELHEDADGVAGTQSLEQFDHLMDEFLEKHDVVGRRMVDRHGGDGCEGVDDLRHQLRETLVISEQHRLVEEGVEIKDADLPQPKMIGFSDDEHEDRWDCETILSTCRASGHPWKII